ncbi:hypothetical protein Agub_g7448, partial [Astrephomene gubernaculifera]
MACIKQLAGIRTRVPYAQPCIHTPGKQAPTTFSRITCKVAKTNEALSTEEELQRLRHENELLRKQLALYQQATGHALPLPPALAAAPAPPPSPSAAATAAEEQALAPQPPPLEHPRHTDPLSDPDIRWPAGPPTEPRFWERPARTRP